MPILTIDSARLNGTPSTGTVRITASRSPLMDSGSNTVYSGTQTFPLDAQGKLSVSLPATDSPSIGPFTYVVEANLASGQWVYRGVKLPAGVATIDITDAQSASQNMYPTRAEWDAITAGMNTAIEGKVTGTGMTLRHDTSVGERILLDHPGGSVMLHGDTGWREITTLENGWTGSILVRRILDTIHISGNDVSGADATAASLLTLPGGYIPRRRAPISVQLVGGAPLYGRVHTSRFIQADYTTSPTLTRDIYGVYPTVQAWPTTLPGTPA